jgi:hypothetical protein
VAGSLPPGLTLDSFSGLIAGTPTTNGVFQFSIRVRDYHKFGEGVTRFISLGVLPSPTVHLAVSINNQPAGGVAQLVLHGTTGQRQIIQVSSNLFSWMPIATNSSGTNLFQLIETNSAQFTERFYRAVVIP